MRSVSGRTVAVASAAAAAVLFMMTACAGTKLVAKWKDDAFAFLGKGLRTTQIEFFSPAALKEADSWIHA